MRPQPVPSADAVLPWWASPAGLTLGFLMPILLLVAYVGHLNFQGLTVRGVWFFTTPYVVLGLGLLAIIAVGCWIGAQIVPVKPTPFHAESVDGWETGAMVVGVIALIAYLYFFKSLIFNPIRLLQTFTGAYRPDRTNLEEVAGLTSFENVAPVFFSVYAFRVISLRRATSTGTHLLCAALLALTAMRVYAWGERLALIEGVVPFALAAATRLTQSRFATVRLTSVGGPFFAIPLLIVYFGLAESVRSWNEFYSTQGIGFWQFAIGRIASYYVTSLNNGAGLLQTTNWPLFDFQYTLAWLHKIPFFGQTFSAYVNAGGDPNEDPLQFFLMKYGDPEFNNPSGLYSVICDIGLPLGVAYFSLMGVLGGMLYRSYKARRLSGVLWYPMFFLAFLELFRYSYLGTQRAFVWAIGIGIVMLMARRPAEPIPLATRAAAPHG